MPSKTAIIILVLIVFLGGFLRFWSLGSTELIHDEGLDIFRSIGYLDYLDSNAQSTPIQWFVDKPLPWWTSLSFHDDPPLFFIIQHSFISVFGESLFVARLPSALAGIGSIILIFFIVRRLVLDSGKSDFPVEVGLPNHEFSGLVASFVLSINFAHIWISRIAILESLVIFFVLLNIYFFVRFVENQKRWILFSLTLGVCFLTKYTSIFIVPVYITYLLIFNRTIFKKRNLYFAIFFAIIIFSPVIIYNIYLYQTFGHFDLQIATLFHQNITHWQGESGKTQEPFLNIKENLLAVYSFPFLLFAILGIVVSLAILLNRRDIKCSARHGLIFSLAMIVSLTMLFVFIGSAIRFVVFYSIPITMIIAVLFAVALVFVRASKNKLAYWPIVIIFGLFFVYEGIFTARTMQTTYSADFGILATDNYFDSIFKNMRPPGLLQHQNLHLNAIIQKYASKYPNTLSPTGIIYDDNIELPHRLWLLSRRELYHGIPIMPASVFLNTIQKEGIGQFAGFTLYFVKADIGAPVRATNQFAQATQIEESLKKDLKLSPDATFYDDAGSPAFRIYKFVLKS